MNLRPMEGRLFLREEELDEGIALILAAEKRLQSAAEDAIKKAGLTHGEFELLMGIRARPGHAVNQLRTHLAMTVPTFARLLGRLDRKGLVTKKKSGQDGRAHLLYLNARGEALAAPLAAAMRDVLRVAYRQTGAEDVAGARAVLEAIMGHKDKHE